MCTCVPLRIIKIYLRYARRAGLRRQRRNPDRDGAKEHRRLEEAALARDADTAAAVLVQHLTLTAAALTGDSGQAT